MAVFFIASYDVLDFGKYNAYAQQAGALAVKHGGKPLVVAPDATKLEGEPNQMNIVIQFPNQEAAMGWYNDPDYQPLKQLRWEVTENGNAFLANRFVPPSAG